MSGFDDEKTDISHQPAAHHAAGPGHDSDDHSDMADHVDERWLVSYADMMTLLFGLFVLLYSMANLDKAAAQKVMESTQEKFGAPVTEAKPKEPEPVNVKDLQDRVAQLEKMQAILQTEKQESLAKLEQASVDLEKIKSVAKIESEKLAQDKVLLERQLEDLTVQLDQSKKQKDKVDKSKDLTSKREEQDREKIRKLTAELEVIQQKQQAKEDKFRELVTKQKETIATLKDQLVQAQQRDVASIKPEEVEKLREQVVTTKTANQEMKQEIRELKEQLETANGNSSSQAFIAVFINWSTKDHDIDLVIKDPNNNTFDFKKRKHGSSPGFFALDTRRGPGAELWQADRIIPGKYTATYSFYNQYGNTEAAKVSGTIYSPKGSFEISPVQMDINSKRKYEVSFEVNAKGDVQILNQR